MICLSGELGKGSCRSYGGFNLFDALTACAPWLEGFGGHALAAGLTIKRENVDGFRAALAEYYKKAPPPQPAVLACELRVEDPALLTMDCVASLERLEPYGAGNRAAHALHHGRAARARDADRRREAPAAAHRLGRRGL